MFEQLLAWKAMIIGVWLALFFILERLSPASAWKPTNPQQQFSQLRHLTQNTSLWLLNALISPLILLSVTAWAVNLHPSGPSVALFQAFGEYRIFIDLLLLDLWIYGWHRLNHRLPWLWRFHQVHHLDQQLDATSALRFHPGEVVLSALFRLPVILVFAMPLSSILVFEILVAVAAIFHHANLRLPGRVENALAAVVITPSIHWVHHHAVRADTDSNYGTLLSCWDRVFRSRSATLRSGAMVLGVEGLTENRLLKLILLPFRS
jgi:sterol desaturase/sphingolipid hydroxylase (fatty acid hydroxylase superfamily)